MPVRTAWRRHSWFGTGSMPGKAASTSATCVFGSAPKAVAAPETSLASLVTWAWTSSPITTSHSPVAPWIRYSLMAGPCLALMTLRTPFVPAAAPVEQPEEGLDDDVEQDLDHHQASAR